MSVVPEHLKFDVRLIKRELRHSRLDPKELEEHLKSLPDCSENASWLHLDGTPCSPEEEKELLSQHEETGLLYFNREEKTEEESSDGGK